MRTITIKVPSLPKLALPKVSLRDLRNNTLDRVIKACDSAKRLPPTDEELISIVDDTLDAEQKTVVLRFLQSELDNA
jgi:hypothetical protein